MNPILGMIFSFAGNFAPHGYIECSGQLLPITQNTALFSILGTTYGGNGVNTFALPDLRGRAMVGEGQGPGLSPYVLGQRGGVESTTLISANTPPHTHAFNVNTAPATTNTPGNAVFLAAGLTSGSGPNATVQPMYTANANAGLTALNSLTISPPPAAQPFQILSPYLTVTQVIAILGIFPSRN